MQSIVNKDDIRLILVKIMEINIQKGLYWYSFQFKNPL